METLKKRRIEKFEIILEHDVDEQYQYVPGEMMHGVIVISCLEEVKLNGLSVTLKGEGNVVWEDEGKPTKKQTKYKAKEIYLDLTENLVTTTASNPSVALEPGSHEYPFYFELPETIPSSYIGKYGGVTYLVKAQLRPDRKYGSDAMITSEPFLILRRYDLSLEPSKLQPYEEMGSQNTGICGCSGGKIKASIKLNRTAFIPGEDLRLNAEVTNGSPYEITAMLGAIVLTAKFHANNEIIQSDQVINKKVDTYAVDQGEGRRWNDIRLTIPPYIPESSLEGCDIIDVNYELLFVCEVKNNPRSKYNLRIVVPITIGTHGLNADENEEEDGALRPLYHRMAANRPADATHELQEEIIIEDDMGELDHSLFDTDPKQAQHRQTTRGSALHHNQAEQTKQEKKPNIQALLFGDIVSSDQLPSDMASRQNTVRGTTPQEVVHSHTDGTPKKPFRKKKAAPAAPDTTEMQGDDNPGFDHISPTQEQTQL